MGIFDRFPYSSTHEMNLDFMLGKATEIAEDMQTVTTGMAQVQAGLSAISEKTEQATQAAAQAAQSASSIEGSVTAAEEAAEEAQMHNESAQTWANNALTYKADCQRAATEAAASSSSAAQAATAAAASEDTVAQYAQAANASAQSAANNNDSAHQYANQASASASNATFHSSNAQTAATNAQTAATNANTSATNASASADRAATLKTDVETLHRMCVAAVDQAATEAVNAANSAAQAAATKTDVENLVESLPEDFPDLNNTVNQLSDEIADIATPKTVYGKNLYNPNDADYMSGYRASNTTGLPSEDSAWNLTGFIPLAANETVVVSRGSDGIMENSTNVTRIYAYKTDKTFLSATYNTGISFYTAPAECAYIRCAVSSMAAFRDHQIEYGQTISAYEPYVEPERIIEPTQGFMEQIKTSKIDNDALFVSVDDVIYKSPIALPSNLYAFAGQPIKMYFYNITDYQLSDIFVSVANSNKGKLFSGGWEYTPENAENITFRVNIYDHGYHELNNETFTIAVKSESTKSALTALVIGDSTVQAGTETQKMLDIASADNYPLTLLGTRGTAPNLTEGRGGWTAYMYTHNAANPAGTVVNAFFNPSTQSFDFSYYMQQQNYSEVDCVFIQLGINDIFSAKTEEQLAELQAQYWDSLDTMISSIHAYNPNIKIVVNTIIPCDTNETSFGNTYGVVQTVWRNHHNVYETNIGTIARYANTQNVHVSPYCMSIDCATQIGGDVHPTEAGYEALGTQMYSYMRAIN